MAAIATVGAVVVALGIAPYADKRAGDRIRDEHERSDRQLREERERAASELAGQREHERAALEDKRACGRQQLDDERRLSLEREQLEHAYRVQVEFGQRPGKRTRATPHGDAGAPEAKHLAVMVSNSGSYTITRVDAQFCLDSNAMIMPDRYERLESLSLLPEPLRGGYRTVPGLHMRGVLTPYDTGIRFETDEIHERHLAGAYPVVQWTDHWGTRWQHKKGVAQRIADDAPWEP